MLPGIVTAADPAATAQQAASLAGRMRSCVSANARQQNSASSVSPADVVSSTVTGGAATNAPSNHAPAPPSEMITCAACARNDSVARRNSSGAFGTKPTSASHSSAFGLTTSGPASTPSRSASPLASSATVQPRALSARIAAA